MRGDIADSFAVNNNRHGFDFVTVSVRNKNTCTNYRSNKQENYRTFKENLGRGKGSLVEVEKLFESKRCS